jgi:hypothetical protein
MKAVGRKIYYDKLTGNILLEKGEMFGAVRETTKEEDFRTYKELMDYNPENVGEIQLAYGERSDEFIKGGSMEVKYKTLHIYPRLQIAADKAQVVADGTDEVTVTITIDDKTKSYVVDLRLLEDTYQVDVVDGKGTFTFSAEIEGTYTLTASSEKWGTNSVTIKGVLEYAESRI